MRRILSLIVAVLTAGCGSPDDAPESPDFVIDVRTKGEFDSGHIENALNIPFETIGDRIAGVTQDKGATIVVYCRSGRRSGIALKTLEGMGYTNGVNVGGYEGYKRRLPISD